ncbi:MAG: hypothetical protein RL580_638, partial [Pseudomonadota bacterium]
SFAMISDPLWSAVAQNIAFFTIASLYVWIGSRRLVGTAAFPGPRPPPDWFKVWLVVIWLVGLVLPVITLVLVGLVGGAREVTIGLTAYLAMFVAQVATELFVWKRWRSPIWVIVPCLYLSWRLWQIAWAWDLPGAQSTTLASLTYAALFALWVINIGVHFTNIPRTLRWDYHPPSATFPSLHDPRVLTRGAHDPVDS